MTTLGVRPPRRTAPTRRAVKGQTRGDRTRQLIIDETIRCVREEGFAAISASYIAERGGVTWGVIQYHFGDRNAVLMAVVDQGYDLLRDAIDDVELPVGSLRERVQAIVDAGWNAFSNPASPAAFRSLSPHAPAGNRGSKSTWPNSRTSWPVSGVRDRLGRGRRRGAIGNLFWAAAAWTRLGADGRPRATRLHSPARRPSICSQSTSKSRTLAVSPSPFICLLPLPSRRAELRSARCCRTRSIHPSEDTRSSSGRRGVSGSCN